MKFEKIILAAIVLCASFLILYKISINPPGLYIDEVSIGYNAHKILTTGKDEYGVAHPLWFRSFGDYKMPIYIYSVAGAMSIFGKNEFSIRLPSAIAGIVSIFLIYFFVQKLLEIDKSFSLPYKKYLPLLSALLLAISSWHIHFSRGGFEVNEGLCFYLSGVLLFLQYIKKKNNLSLFLGVMLCIVSIYTYHTFRIIAPLTVLFSLGYFYSKSPKQRKSIIMAFVVFIVFFIPIVQFSMTKAGSERFSQTSAFSEYKADTLPQKVVTYPLVYIKNFLSFFSLDFLFNFGDGIGRHQIAGFGLLYKFEFIFLFFGLYALFKKKKSYMFYVLIGILLLGVAPAALSRPSPHSLRSLLMMIPLLIIIAIGFLQLVSGLKRYQKIVLIGICTIALYELLLVSHFYTYHYPKINLLDWGAGYKDIVVESAKVKKDYQAIVVDKRLGDVVYYYHFYDETIPFVVVGDDYKKPDALKDKKVLYIRPYYGKKEDKKIVKNITFPNVNKDVFAQFWEL